MQFARRMRIQVVAAGLGMALLCAGATKAQEIVNTRFDDGPNVAPLVQPAAVSANAAQVTGGQATAAKTALPVAAPANEAESTTLLWLGSSLVWLGAIGMYFSGPAKRFALELRTLRASRAA
jgi:hypothetical protein